MDSAQKLAIGDVLDFYQTEVVPAIAAALVVDDKFPEEVLNEIRNSFTHLAAANCCSDDELKFQKELHAAHRHLRRTCIDSLKVCIFVQAKKCEKAIDALTSELQLPADIYTKMSDLRRARKQLAAQEGQRSLEDAVEEYKALANSYDEFYSNLDKQFAGDTAPLRVLKRIRREWRGGIVGFLIAVAGTWFFEGHPPDWLTELLKSISANTPSTP